MFIKYRLLLITLFSCMAFFSNAQTTSIPDEVFEDYLETHNALGELVPLGDATSMGNGIANDHLVTTSRINTITGLNLYGLNMVTIEGISDFTDLVYLNISANSISNLDVGNILPNLNSLIINNSGLTSLKISSKNNSDGTSIISNISNLVLTNNTNLEFLEIQDTKLTSINTTTNPALKSFNLAYNPNLISLDVSNNNLSTYFRVEACLSLRSITFNDTNFSEIVGLSSLANLESLLGNNSAIQELDVSNQPALSILELSNNTNITTINISNTAVLALDVSTNTQLQQLTLHDGINTNSHLRDLDISNRNFTTIDLSFISSLRDLTANNTALQSLVLTQPLLTDLSITDCPNLLTLDIGNAQNLATIDVTNNTALTNLSIGITSLSSDLDLSTNTALTTLSIGANPSIRTLDLSNNNVLANLTLNSNMGLTYLDVSNTLINSLTLNSYGGLSYLNISNTLFTSLSFSGNFNLETLVVDNSKLEQLIVGSPSLSNLVLTNNVDLLVLSIDYALIHSLELATNPMLEDITIRHTPNIIDLVIDNSEIKTIDLFFNLRLANLEITNNADLLTLDMYENAVTRLDLSTNPILQELDIQSAKLESINLKNNNNTAITNIDLTSNTNLTCVLVDNEPYSTTNWTSKDLHTSYNDVSCDILISPRVYLQGAALQPIMGEETLMRDDLRTASLLPTTSPYSDYTTCDPAVFSTTGTNAIVDWVWVELRDATDNTIIQDAQSALLQRDGDVVALDGISAVSFKQTESNYYIAIKHRNHLAVVTSNTVALSLTTTSVDFTNGTNQITYGTNAQTTFGMQTDIVAMWTGNVNNDTVVQYSGTSPDTPTILSAILNDAGNFLNFPTYAVSGYNNNDVNMDGNIQYSGTNPDTPFILQNVFAHPENSLNFSTYQIIEQLPENFNQ